MPVSIGELQYGFGFEKITLVFFLLYFSWHSSYLRLFIKSINSVIVCFFKQKYLQFKLQYEDWKKLLLFSDRYILAVIGVVQIKPRLFFLFQPVSRADRETMSRVKNCIAALVASDVKLDATSINFAYEESLKYESVKEFLEPEAMLDVAFLTQHRIKSFMEGYLSVLFLITSPQS